MIHLTRDEAAAAITAALEEQGVDFETFDPLLQVSAIAGAMNIVRGLELLGFRIARPLALVGSQTTDCAPPVRRL